MRVVVLGAGVIGVTTAYFLHKNGHQVTVIDRQNEAAAECSFANGGQLSYSHGEPWASPESLKKAFKWLFKDDAPLKFRFRADWPMWKWAFAFAAQCTDARTRANTITMLRLGLYSRTVMHEMQDASLGLEYSYRQSGILHLFDTKEALEGYAETCRFQEGHGVPFSVLSREEMVAKEPALATRAQDFAGAIFNPLDESGNINRFVRGLADYLAGQGVIFRYNTVVQELVKNDKRLSHVVLKDGEELHADNFVLSLGADSPLLANALGIRLPIYPMKGYSLSMTLKPDTPPSAAPQISLTDQRYKVVYSHFGDVLRLAGTAEFSGYNYDITPDRIALLKHIARTTFGELGTLEDATGWACLRPSTPDGPPILGRSRIENLYLNTGHGTLGWTQAAGSAKIVADIIDGREPGIALDGLTVERFH